MTPTRSLLTSSALLAILASTPALAQKSILTGGPSGAYHTLFCPPLPSVLDNSMFGGYKCQTSGGTGDNIKGVLASPTNIGFVQLDVLARQAAADPALMTKISVIRKDLACEGLWMITKENPQLRSYGDVLAYARRIPFVLPAQGSGSEQSFAYNQSIDPEGLGRAKNIRYVADATTVINTVAASTDKSVGFFVQFADPENANIKLLKEKGLTVIPVIARELTKANVSGEALYDFQSFSLTSAGWVASGEQQSTACTPVAIITGNPDAARDQNAKDDQKDLIKAIREVPAAALLPKDSRIAKLMQSVKHISGGALNDALALADKAKKAAQDAMSN